MLVALTTKRSLEEPPTTGYEHAQCSANRLSLVMAFAHHARVRGELYTTPDKSSRQWWPIAHSVEQCPVDPFPAGIVTGSPSHFGQIDPVAVQLDANDIRGKVSIGTAGGA